MKTYKVIRNGGNFRIGTMLTGRVEQFIDGLRLIVEQSNGVTVKGFLTEKMGNLAVDWI